MPSYVDTSALLRLVERRGEVSLVEAAMTDEPLASTLAELECWVAVHKRWHGTEIDTALRDELLGNAQQTLSAVNLVALDDGVVSEARVLAQRYALRILDALHLATAVLAHERLLSTGGVRFCTADRRQADAARHRLGADRVALVPPWR